VVVDASTQILDHDKNPIALAQITVGAIVEVEGFLQTDGSILASKVKLEDAEDDEDSDDEDSDEDSDEDEDSDDDSDEDSDEDSDDDSDEDSDQD
jgi:hypothetical protein